MARKVAVEKKETLTVTVDESTITEMDTFIKFRGMTRDELIEAAISKYISDEYSEEAKRDWI
jgi:metal-responsive CopG/Arc/MetJ family transcriptional regulator